MVGLSLGLMDVATVLNGGGGGGPAPDLGPYLSTLSSSPLAVWGAKRMVDGYSGNLYQLRRDSDDATLDVAPASNIDLPDYEAIQSWAGGAGLFVTAVYDQSGNSDNLTQGTEANQPLFDIAMALAGCVPFAFDSQFEVAGTRKFMSNAGLSYTGQNVSVWQVLAPMVSSNTMMYWSLHGGGGTGGSLVCNCYQTAATAGIVYFNGGSLSTGAGGIPRAQPSVIGTNMSGSTHRTTIREATIDNSVGAATAGNFFLLGYAGHFGFAGYELLAHVWATILYPSLSNGDQATLRTDLEAIYEVPTTFDSRIVFTGDSIMDGWRVDRLRSMPNELQRLGALPGTPEIFNVAIAGQTMVQDRARYASFMDPLFTSAYGAGNCLLVIESGTNDIHVSSTSGADLTTTATSFVGDAEADGYVVGITTLLPYTFPNSETTDHATYRTNVLNGDTGAGFTIDTYTATNADENNSATYYQDTIHPTGTLQGELAADEYGPAITTALA